MDKAARVRWSVLLFALSATIGAMVMPASESEAPPSPARRAHHATPDVRSPHRAGPELFEAEAETDPFVARVWSAPPEPVPAATAISTQVAPPIEAAPKPTAPPLPYRYVGRFSDDSGGFIYLADGDTAHAVRNGDVISGTHKIVLIEPRRIVFAHLPTGIEQDLPLPDPDQQ